MANRYFLFVVNPAAGKRNYHDKIKAATELLKSSGFPYQVYYTEVNNSIDRLRQFLTKSNYITDIVIIGGDGTINLCINALPHFDIAVSIIRNGTGNDAMKNIYPRKNFEQQINNIILGKITTVDLGKCNERLFINGVGIGFDGLVAKELGTHQRKRKGLWAYLSIVLLLLPKPQKHRLVINTNGKEIQKHIFSITITKGTTFGGGFLMNPHADRLDGFLDICIFNKLTFLHKLLILPWVFIGKHGWFGKIEFHKFKDLKITSESEILAHMDGELFSSDEFRFEVVPQKLKIRV